MKERIQLTDTTMEAIIKMAEGNPGAVQALCALLEHHNKIDPQAMLGGMGAILMLDGWGIYGSSIYILFSDKCKRDVRKMLLLMRAAQLGFLPVSRIKEMAADQARKIELTPEEWLEIDEKVCGELEEFAKAAA